MIEISCINSLIIEKRMIATSFKVTLSVYHCVSDRLSIRVSVNLSVWNITTTYIGTKDCTITQS